MRHAICGRYFPAWETQAVAACRTDSRPWPCGPDSRRHSSTTEKLMPIIAVEIHGLKCVVPSNRNVGLNNRVPKVSSSAPRYDGITPFGSE